MIQRKTLTTAFLLSCSILTTQAVAACEQHHDGHYASGAIEVQNAWSRPTPPGTPMGVGYMTITNHGADDVLLIAAESPRAGHVSIHETSMHEGMMRMQPLANGLTIPAGKSMELKPHSYHLMLEQLEQPLIEGEKIPVKLDFDGGEDITVKLVVQPLGGTAMDHGDHADHSDMHH
ncbi:copper chaperone PCu(A)C [Marinobacter litoralis]|uniref:copper chaperone PCu(A)C n=1 Tax=Marinobacter litoralis TaxID=187981 RepID=UPI0018EDAA75|nr:copper chaperone PCu(A)C [Marinobacter litoralis]MBJ6139004.1 copper chaperone PCu(A)C [Marinobacter litoralis]